MKLPSPVPSVPVTITASSHSEKPGGGREGGKVRRAAIGHIEFWHGTDMGFGIDI